MVMTDSSYHMPEDHTLRVQQLFMQHQQAVLGYVLSIEPNFASCPAPSITTVLVVPRFATFCKSPLGLNFCPLD
jgi:hypothetical protein